MDLQKSSWFAEIKSFSEENKNLSLKEKLTLRYNEHKKQPIEPTPEDFNKCLPIVFIMETFCVWYFGVVMVLPYFYSHNIILLRAFQTLACFIGTQMLINVLCVHYVESVYNPWIHGTKPETFVDPQSSIVLNYEVQDNNNDGQTIQPTASRIPRYWVWGYCKLCDKPRPPRCHHCVLCGKCVLKRDHHCFFARRCVGFHNLRHFTVFLFYSTFGSIFAIMHFFPYVLLEVLPNNSYIDIIPFATFLRCLFGYGHFRAGALTLAFWMLVLMVIYTLSLITDNWKWILHGKTSFEIDNNLKITNTNSIREKLRAVFGDYWVLNFIVPLHTVFEPHENPVTWPNIQVN